MLEKFITKDDKLIAINPEQVVFVVEENSVAIVGLTGNVNIALKEDYLEVLGRLIGSSNCGGCR